MDALQKPITAGLEKDRKALLLRLKDPDTSPERISRALNNLCRMMETQPRHRFG